MNQITTWVGATKEEIVTKLVDEFGYDPKTANVSCEKIIKFAEELRPAFLTYFKSHKIENVGPYHGWTIERLIKEMKMVPVGAFITLDWIIREPRQALDALSHGYDTVIT